MIILIFWALIASGWTLSMDTGLNLSQSYYNDEWKGSDAGAITWTSFANVDLSRQLTKTLLLSNSLKLAYGQTHSQNSETKRWNAPEKSTDKIDEEAMLRFTVKLPVDPFLSLRFLSQFYDKPETLFINPISLTESFGLARVLARTEGKEVTTRLGIAFKEEIDRSDTEGGPVEGGLEWVSWGRYKFSKSVLYEGRLRVYKYLYNSKSEELPDENWKAPDIDFENTISVSLSKFIQLTLYIQVIYEKEQTANLQIKENIAVGLNYKFF